MKKVLLMLSLPLILMINQVVASEKIKVAFVNPGVSTVSNATGGFWFNVTSFMKAAANDLNIELKVYYAERNHLKLKKLVNEIATGQDKPDYLVIVNEKNQGAAQLDEAFKGKIKTFVILNTLAEKELGSYGSPRQKHADWIGSLVPDNEFAGRQIAEHLIRTAKSKGLAASDGKLQLIGIAGDKITPAAVQRNDGLNAAIAQSTNVSLKQIFSAEWSRDKAKISSKQALKRYPELGAIWAANDPIALGALEAVNNDSSKKAGNNILIGGLNWDIPALEQIQKGNMDISMGGHFMTGGWAMVLLHDYHNGKDFAQNGAALKMKIFDKIDDSNVKSYLDKFGDKNWDKIDFTRFSKALNSDVKQYEFSLTEILKQPDL